MQTLRRAIKEDADSLVKLIVIAGDGLPYYVWRMMQEDGESLHDTGRRRALREEGAFSYRNAWVVEAEGKAVSALIGYRLPEEVEPVDHDAMPAMFVPFQEMENLVPGSWYVNVLATLDDFRSRGFATELLVEAESEAQRSGATEMSIITGDINPALNLYRSFGFVEKERKPIVKNDWDYEGLEWVLLVKQLHQPNKS